MKKIIIFITFISAFFLMTFNVNADTTKVKMIYSDVTFRKGPGTNYASLGTLADTQIYPMLSSKLYKSESGCSAGWYYINNEGTKGYVCATYVKLRTYKTTDMNNCKTKLSKKGFPSTYLDSLCELQLERPNWVFEPIITNLDFTTSVKKEAQCGVSYVYTSSKEDKDTSCNNPYKTTGYGLYPASKKAVAYYMDPRNFFFEKYVFQFENLTYSNSLETQYQKGAKTILQNTEFYKYHTSKGRNVESNLNKGAKAGNVNAIFLAARIKQELGSTNKLQDLYSGVYTGYSKAYYGYYNYVNFGVSDTCVTKYGAAYCGLSTAKSNKWNSFYNGFYGAALFLSDGYISQGQYTNYLQRFNVVPKNAANKFVHQYMTSVHAPSSESSSTYDSYEELGLLSTPFVFYIPVYNNITATIDNSGSGASDDSGGNTKTNAEINTIVKSAGYRNDSGYMVGVKANSSISNIKSAISSVGGTATFKNKSGATVTSGIVGTGYKVTVKNKTTSQTYTIVVKGDTSGDGQINALDLLQVQKQILGTYSLGNSNKKAADTSGDGKVNALDLLQVQKQILGTYNIKQ